MSSIKEQILTLVKQRHHSHKVSLEQEKDPRSKHAIDLIARIREDSQLIDLIDTLPEEKPSEDLEEAAEEWAENEAYGKSDAEFEMAYKGFIAGEEWQKGQIMKEVKYGVVCKKGERDEEDVWIELNPGSLPDYKDTDPIDFIIVKQ